MAVKQKCFGANFKFFNLQEHANNYEYAITAQQIQTRSTLEREKFLSTYN